MLLNRRSILRGLLAAPIVITTPGLLMPVHELKWTYDWKEVKFLVEVLNYEPGKLFKVDDIVEFPTGYFTLDGKPEILKCIEVHPNITGADGVPLQSFSRDI